MTDGRWIPERLRWAHRWYARANGYFWAPCVLCGREFGGHEWRDIGGKPSGVYLNPPSMDGTAICPWCTRDGKGQRPPGVICFCRECLRRREGISGSARQAPRAR
jgi:hypothetical protein